MGYGPKDKRWTRRRGIGLWVFLAARANTLAVYKVQARRSYTERLLYYNPS